MYGTAAKANAFSMPPLESPGTKQDHRAAMLRGVYEENRKVANMPVYSFDGIRPPRRRRVQRVRWAGVAAGVAAAVVAVLAGFVYHRTAQQEAGLGRTSEAQTFSTISAEQGAAFESAPPITPVGPLNTPEVGSGALPSASRASLAHLFNLQVRTIVIDPGHGGRDPGAVGPSGAREKEITLDVAMRLKARLEKQYGYQILMTRAADVTQTLRARADFANAQHADLFISIHVNDLPAREVTSVETYYFGLEGSREALALAERENRGADYSLADFREMTRKIGTTIKFQESERLARAIQGRMYRAVSQARPDVQDWGVRTAPFMVLLGVEAPSVLAEIACISNPGDEADLLTGAYRERLAEALEKGILDYVSEHPIQSPQGATTDGSTKE